MAFSATNLLKEKQCVSKTKYYLITSDVLIRPKRSTLGSRKADCVSIVYGVFGDYFMFAKCLILLEAGTGIEPVYTDLQLEDSNIILIKTII